MSELTKITTHETDAVARLLSQFKGKPKLEGLIKAFAAGHQNVEDAFWDLYTERQLDVAEGAQLDGIGKIVGEDRRGRNDADYRIALYGRIGVNTSKGTAEDLISIFKLLTGATTAHYYPLYPAECYIMAAKDLSSMDTDAIYAICQQVVAGGVRVSAIGSYMDDDAFTFDGPFGKGFDDLNDPGNGGEFAGLNETYMGDI